jgi:hypothetical protein
MLAGGAHAAQTLAGLMASAKPAGEVLAFANEYVRVRYAAVEYAPSVPPVGESRPVVLYIRVDPGPGILNRGLLEPPGKARPERDRGAAGRGIHIEVLKPPPAPSALGEPGSDLPRNATDEAQWEGGRLVLATFESMAFGVGTGRFPSVTTFLSGGMADVTTRRVRRRIGVRAGDAFWFDAGTRLTVVGDDPVGAAIVHFYPAAPRAQNGAARPPGRPG